MGRYDMGDMGMGRDGIPDAETVDGLGVAREILEKFFEKNLRSAESDEAELKLFQKTRSGGEQEIDSFTFIAGDTDPDAMISEILDKAETDAERWRGKTRYSVRIDGRTKVCTFHLIVPILDGDGIDDYGEPEEFANGAGIIGQAMRHAEVFAREMMVSTRAGRDDNFRHVEALRQDNERLRKEIKTNQDLREKLISMEFARNLELRKLEAEEERKDKILAVLGQAVPMLATKLLGPGAMPSLAPSPIETMLEGLFESMKQEQLIELAGHMSPEQQQRLMEIHQALLQRREAMNQQAAAQRAQQQGQQGQQGQGHAPPPGYGPPFGGAGSPFGASGAPSGA